MPHVPPPAHQRGPFTPSLQFIPTERFGVVANYAAVPADRVPEPPAPADPLDALRAEFEALRTEVREAEAPQTWAGTRLVERVGAAIAQVEVLTAAMPHWRQPRFRRPEPGIMLAMADLQPLLGAPAAPLKSLIAARDFLAQHPEL